MMHLSLKAVYSRSLASARSVAPELVGVDYYADDSNVSYDDVLNRTDISAVIIAYAKFTAISSS